MAKNIGIFICGCQGLVSDAINFTRLEEELAKLKKSVGARQLHPWLCGDDGRDLIRNDIILKGLDCVILAGCPYGANDGLFSSLSAETGLPEEMVLRVDIREGCAFPHQGNLDEALRKAVNLIRMWTARARLTDPHIPVTLPGNREVAVVGGGLAGLTAALDLAEAGINVTLIERESYLGGNVARLNKIFPRMCDARCGLTYLYQKIRETGKVRLMTLSEVSKLEGTAGRYEATVVTTPRYVREGLCNGCGKCADVCPVETADSYNFNMGSNKAVRAPYHLDPEGTYLIERKHCPNGCDACRRACPAGAIDFSQQPEEKKIKFGSAVVATGWSSYPAERIERFGYGVLPDVITNMQMERMTAEDGPTGGRIICPGSGSEARSIVFIQCAGSRDVWHQGWCSSVCCTASIKQALYIKEKSPQNRVYILYNDIRTPGEYEDLYVRAQRAGVLFIRTNPAEVRAESSGLIRITAEDTLAARIFQIEADLVVLAVGITPNGSEIIQQHGHSLEYLTRYGLVSAGGFYTGHKQCFPLESDNQGIFFSGCCQEPMDMGNTVKSALAATGRVFKTAGASVPVASSVAVVDRSGCDKCKRCLEECPYGVIYLDQDGFPVPEELFCRGCHTCMGSCPRRCIVPQGFGIKQQIAMIGSGIKESAPGEPVVIAFMCENDAYPAAREAGRRRIPYPAGVHVIPVKCIGSVNMLLIKDGISKGIDGFILAGCRSGECHYISGSERAEERLNNMKDTFREMMMEDERVEFLRLGIGQADLFAKEAVAFVDRLREMGPNPFRTAIMV